MTTPHATHRGGKVESFQMALDLFAVTRAEWLARAKAYALFLGSAGIEVTADDIHDHIPIPQEFDGRVMGAVFHPCVWECVGYVKSRRPICHGRRIGVFRLKGAVT